MIERSTQRLSSICDRIPPLLSALDEGELARKPEPGKWSKKQILGHLIDSAANNHHRVVRGHSKTGPPSATMQTPGMPTDTTNK